MKILYLHPGSWIGEYGILTKLKSLGHDICVLEERRHNEEGKEGEPRPRRAREYTADFLNAGDGITTFWYDPHRGAEKLLTWPIDRFFKKSFEGRNLAHRMWVIAAAVRRFRPDIVVCSDGFTYAIPTAFLKRLGLLKQRLVVSYIGGDILDCPEYGVGKRRTPLISWLIQNSLPGIDVMRPLCDSLARILIKEGADLARIKVWPIQLLASTATLDDIHAHRAELRTSVRDRYGIAHDAPLVITLSGNHKGKGLQDLAAAWPTICAMVPGCQWLLCGPENPWLAEGVRPVIAAAKLDATVHYSGALRGSEVFEHMAAADLHVNPTLCEGLNMVTVEAAAVGTPSVSSDGAGIADWIESHHAGLVVPAGDVDALSAAVIAAASDTPDCAARRLTWGTRSRTMAGDFSQDRIAAGMLRIFEGKSPESGLEQGGALSKLHPL